MTTKILSGQYSSGYYLQASVTFLSITPTGLVEDTGIHTYNPNTKTLDKSSFTVVNDGTVFGGMRLWGPSSVTNGSATDHSAYIQSLVDGQEYKNISGVARVTNFALIGAPPHYTAIQMVDGGYITNGSATNTVCEIFGSVEMGDQALAGGPIGPGTVTNYATIATGYNSAIVLYAGGRITNGTSTDTVARIYGGGSAVVSLNLACTVTNFGTIFGRHGYGVDMVGGAASLNNQGTITGNAYGVDGACVWFRSGGTITSGSASNSHVKILGYDNGILAIGATASVTNFGQITGHWGAGIALNAGGGVTNGSNADTKAAISGYHYGVTLSAGTVHNFGAISSLPTTVGAGVKLGSGALFNGSSGDPAASVEGYSGVVGTGAANVINYGAILGAGGPGVSLASGTILNGVAGVIEGASGVTASLTATILNFGAIHGVGGYGVHLGKGGELENGAVALVEGAGGVIATGAALVSNLGVIRASTGVSVSLGEGGSLTNGSASYRGAQMFGATGVVLGLAAVATNFGTIEAYSGPGVTLTNSSTLTNFGDIVGLTGTAVNVGLSSSLVVEPGCVFGGAVNGGAVGGVTLDGGKGTIALLSTGSLVVSGSMARTTFGNFGIIDIDAKSSESLSGTGSVPAFDFLDVAGALSVDGKLNLVAGPTFNPTNGGQLALTGTLSGAGTLTVASGAVASFGAGAVLTIGHVTLSAATSKASLSGESLNYAGAWTQNAGTLSVATGDTITFTGVGDVFRGTVGGAGHVVLGGGTDTLNGVTFDLFATIAGAGTVTATGTNTFVDTLSLQGGTVVVGVGTGGATFAGQTLSLGDASKVIGASSSSTMVNKNMFMVGAGQLGMGQMRLTNEAGGNILAGSNTATLTIDTGANRIVNYGKIGAEGGAGMVIKSAIDNVGQLVCDAANLSVDGSVVGTGSVQVAGATADFASTFTQNVTFGSIGIGQPITGVLELSHSHTYNGTISNFSTTGLTSLDLDDIAFVSGTTKATYSGTTASGILTVTSGAAVARIHFAGDFTTSTWMLSSDGHGGTTVVDPTGSAPTPRQPLIAAMAGFGAHAAGSAMARSLETPRLALPCAARTAAA